MDHYIKYHGEEWRSIVERSLEETNRLADRCNVSFKEGMKIIPEIVENPDKALSDECYLYMHTHLDKLGIIKLQESDGDDVKYETVDGDKLAEYQERMRHELEVIRKMEFSDYFHVVSEYTQWAKDNGIMVGGGRGSAAGSLVAYCMRITSIDPIEYDLLFERFLNRGRAKKPLINFKEYSFEDYEKEIGD